MFPQDRSSSIKYDFIAIIFPHNFVSRASSLAFKEELPIDNTGGVVFGSTNEVGGKVLFSNGGIDLLIESLMVIKWLFSVGGDLDCEGVDWVAFDVVQIIGSTNWLTHSYEVFTKPESNQMLASSKTYLVSV